MTNPPRRIISSGRAPRATSRRSALRGALAAVGGLSLAGCDRLSHSTEFVDVLKSAQDLSHAAHRKTFLEHAPATRAIEMADCL